MKYSIGLDCGIASVGFAVMELDPNDEPCRIIRLGSRIFDKAEHPKDGSSLALPRREARGTRRRIRRHQHRLERIRYMLINEHILTQKELDGLFEGELIDIYELRCKALDECVSNTEFARILIHIAQRRGFKSNRKSDANDKETGALLSAVSENQIRMDSNHYRTVGEMFFKDENYAECKRNKAESYKATVSRAMIEKEIHLIFEAQREYKNAFADEKIEKKYTDIVLSQRPFDLGPGEGSPYAGNQIEKMIGNCTLLDGEKRAAKATYSFQLFTLWQNINHIRLVSASGDSYSLSDSERKAVFDLCHKTASVNYDRIRKALEISDDYYFNALSYGDNDAAEVEKKAKFEYLKPYHQIRKVLDKFKKDYIKSLSVNEINEIGYAFTVFKNDDDILNHLNNNGIEKEIADILVENISSFSKFGHISVKACDKLIPFLEQGMTYDKACESAGIDFKGHSSYGKEMLLPAVAPELENITNPVVRRAVSQTIKVINSIIREQGESPAYVNIELARELSKDFQERNVIEKKNQENRAINEKIVKRLEEEFHNVHPTGLDIVKFKLYEEQNGIDPYTQKSIELNRLFEVGYVDVDHIIPYSISFDDSYNNKVLTFSSENRQKGNRLPLQYLTGKDGEDFRVFVNSSFKNINKRKNLLKEKIDDDGFKSRNLNDTKYLSKVLYNYINDRLLFEEYKNRKKHVRTVNGAITAYMRKRWGIVKIREDGDLHHAVDAAVIACVTEGMIQRITDYAKYKEVQYSDCEEGSVVVNANGEAIDSFPFPYPNFRKELEIRTLNDPQRVLKQQLLSNYTPLDVTNVKPCFVSRMPRHKVTGAAHQDTIRSGKEPGYVISKVPLSKLTIDKEGGIKNYYNPDSDRLLYNALLERLKAFDGDGSKAFPENFEFRKPKADGTDGPVVKKVKLIEKSTLNVKARGENGVADNGSMVRIDVFFVEGEGYYFVPIYVADTVKSKLPNKACIAFKPYDEWKEMKEENFIFSLYPNDLIKVKSKKDMKMSVNIKGSTLAPSILVNDAFFYFVKAGISTGTITVENHDSAYIINSLGIKTLVSIEKYTVDPLGNITAVKNEKRMGFNKE